MQPHPPGIRVLIADDSSLARALLRNILESQPGITVVGEARDGQQVVDMAASLKPSLVTMDLEMPRLSGLQAIEAIMCSRAVPILVVSSVADAQHALEAVARGALEVVAKPDTTQEAADHLVARVRLLAGVSVITRPRRKPALPEPSAPPEPASATPAQLVPPVQPLHPGLAGANADALGPGPWVKGVLAIASSTGGPQALAQILPGLPPDFGLPVVVAQHISDGFAQGMVDWLASISSLPVALMQDGQPLQAGCIYIAPSERHALVTTQHRLALQTPRPGDVYHPCCDVLLQSVAAVFGPQSIGLILSGMGHDGAAGMVTIRAVGGVTLAQDEASSVIYGMNRIAIERGAVQQVLALAEIAPRLVALDRYRYVGQSGQRLQA